MAERILVLGGTRSGKSAVAERLVAAAPSVRYVATAAPADAEMRQRIAEHRGRRPAAWETVETSDLHEAVRGASAGSAILIDALGPWLGQRMADLEVWIDEDVAAWGAQASAGRDEILAEVDALWKAAGAHPGGPVVVVAEEAGLGLAPLGAGARRWIDLSGEITQRLAAEADRALFVVAGRIVELAGEPAVFYPATALEGDLRAHGDAMVPDGAADFAVNIHRPGPPAHIRTAIERARDDLAAYPDDAGARAAIAARHRRPPEEVCVTAGAAEALWLLAGALRGRRAIVVHPAFTEMEAALRHAGTLTERVCRSAARDWALDPSAIPPDADLVVLGNPNNPTGGLDDPGAIAALCRPGRVTVVDEAFMDFVDDPAASLASRRDLPGLAVVRSVTKLWGLAGLRAGYLLAPDGLAARCAAGRQPWSVATEALAALAACMPDEAYRAQVAQTVAGARGALLEALRSLEGIRAWDAAANFVLVQTPGRRDVASALLERGIAVRPSTFPGLGGDYLRITVRDPEANARLVAALAEVVAEAP